MDRWTIFRILAVVTALAALAEVIYLRMIAWEDTGPWNMSVYGWPEVCAVLGSLLLFFAGTQQLRWRSDLQAVSLVAACAILRHQIPFAGQHLFGFLRSGRPPLELAALFPIVLCLVICYFAMAGIISARSDSR